MAALFGTGNSDKASYHEAVQRKLVTACCEDEGIYCALHAIWDNFQTGEKLDFRGEFYTHTLMTPFFSPGSLDVERPQIYVLGLARKWLR